MFKRINNYLFIAVLLFGCFVSCEEETDQIEKFSSQVDISASEFLTKDDDAKYNMEFIFSTDNGASFVDFLALKVGQTYKVKVVERVPLNASPAFDNQGRRLIATEVTPGTCYDIDWSASNPAPKSVDAATGIAEFVMKSENQVKAKVTDHVSPYNAAPWSGAITAYEDYGSQHWGPYDTKLTPDASVANRFHLDNFYDSGLDAYIDYDPATNTVKFPNQTVGGKPITNSSGSFNQCRRQMTIKLNYDGADWTYLFGQH